MSVILLEYEFIRMDGDYCEVAVFKSREMNFNLKKKIYPREKPEDQYHRVLPLPLTGSYILFELLHVVT